MAKIRDAYGRHPLVLVKWIPSQTHHHGEHDEVFVWYLGRIAVGTAHAGIPIVYPRLSDVGHVCDRFIGQVG